MFKGTLSRLQPAIRGRVVKLFNSQVMARAPRNAAAAAKVVNKSLKED